MYRILAVTALFLSLTRHEAMRNDLSMTQKKYRSLENMTIKCRLDYRNVGVHTERSFTRLYLLLCFSDHLVMDVILLTYTAVSKELLWVIEVQ